MSLIQYRILILALIVISTPCKGQTTLQSLKSDHAAELDKLTAQADARRLQNLKRLKLVYTREAKLDDAVAVDKEIKTLERRAGLKAKVENTRWISSSKEAVWTFLPRGVYQLEYQGKKLQGHWQVAADQLVYVTEKDVVFYFHFTEDFTGITRLSPRDDDLKIKGSKQ